VPRGTMGAMNKIRRYMLSVAIAAYALPTCALPTAACAQQVAASADKTARLTVVELFTSQGCSSCPPADATLFTLSDQPDLLTLSWAVDYWDRLGWRDTFAAPAFTRRQHAYNKRLGRGGVYTPQMVIDGELQAVGSRKADVIDAINSARNTKHIYISPALSSADDTSYVDLPATKLTGKVMVHVVWYMADAVVEVGSGENGGRRLHYTNVVRDSHFLADWDGTPGKLKLPGRADAMAKGADHVAVLLQAGFGDGPVIGAARMALKPDTASR